jgi:hypothetical protein
LCVFEQVSETPELKEPAAASPSQVGDREVLMKGEVLSTSMNPEGTLVNMMVTHVISPSLFYCNDSTYVCKKITSFFFLFFVWFC